MANVTNEQVRKVKVAKNFGYEFFIAFPAKKINWPTSEVLRVRLTEAGIPDKANNLIKWTVQGHSAQDFGNSDNVREFTLNFIEDIDATICQAFQDWDNACQNRDTGVSDDKENLEAEIKVLPTNRQGVSFYEFKSIGCLCKSFNPGQLLNGETPSYRGATVTIGCDQARWGKPGQN